MSAAEIVARIDHLSDGVGCFDPIQVLSRLRVAFPELIESSRDYLWETADHLRQATGPGSEAAFLTAVRDMQERWPKLLFTIPLPDGRSISGTTERYQISVSSSEDFPEEFRRRFTDFLKSLFLQPILVTSSAPQ